MSSSVSEFRYLVEVLYHSAGLSHQSLKNTTSHCNSQSFGRRGHLALVKPFGGLNRLLTATNQSAIEVGLTISLMIYK